MWSEEVSKLAHGPISGGGRNYLLSVSKDMVEKNQEWSDPIQIRWEKHNNGENTVTLWMRFPPKPVFRYQHLRERFTTEVLIGCARCGLNHGTPGQPNVWLPLDIPVEDPDGSLWTHWMPCPKNGQPVLMRSVSTSEEPDRT